MCKYLERTDPVKRGDKENTYKRFRNVSGDRIPCCPNNGVVVIFLVVGFKEITNKIQ